MARVNFAFGAPDRLLMACQVARKRYQAGERVVVYCADAPRLTAFDRLLWTFDDIAFVPHVLASDELAAQTPVLLTAAAPWDAVTAWDATAPQATDPWLLNLADECPPGCARFKRIIEIVSADGGDRPAARQRWRQYSADGHDVRSHHVAATSPE